MKLPAWLQKQLVFILEEAGDAVRAYNTHAKDLSIKMYRLQKSLSWLLKKYPKYMFDDDGVKWFVTTIGYKPVYILYGPRKGECIGMMLMDYRVPGYFDTEADAVECVLENHGDIFEYSYVYVIIEPFGSGLYPDGIRNRERFFWWYAGKYMEIGRPHWAKNVVNWSIG